MNNTLLFNAVLSGGAGGSEQLKAGTSTTGDYSQLATRVQNLAVVVDSLIAPTVVTTDEAGLMTEVTLGIIFNRALIGTTPDYASIARDIVAQYQSIRTQLVPTAAASNLGYVDGFATLRTLVDGTIKCVELRYHTDPNDGGGGTFDCYPIAGYADDGGTIAAAGAFAYVRQDSAQGRAPLQWFGGDPTATRESDTAWDLAYAWCKIDTRRRSLFITDGRFLIRRNHIITDGAFTVNGNGRTSVLWRDVVSVENMFTFDRPITGLRLMNFRIGGIAGCGRAAMDLSTGTGCWLEYDVDLTVTGGWEYWLYASDNGTLASGAFQWGRLKLSNIQHSEGPPYYPSKHGIYVAGGYFNCCYISIDTYGMTGDSLHIEEMAGYIGGWCKVTGSIQAGAVTGRPLYKMKGGNYTFEDWAEEANALSSEIHDVVNFIFQKFGTDHPLMLYNVKSSTFLNVQCQIRQDSDCANNEFDCCGGGIDPITRSNLSEISYRGFTATLDKNAAGYGLNEPTNILLGGDMSSWLALPNEQVRPASGNYSATKCGLGLADVTRTRNAKYCALVTSSSIIPAQNWVMSWKISPPLDASMEHCVLTCSVKAKPKIGAGPIGFAVAIGNLNDVGTPMAGTECENGFFLYTFSRPMQAAWLLGDLYLYLYGAALVEFYVAEVTAAFAYHGPRLFQRATDNPFYEGTIDENGALCFYTTGIPAGANDPVYGRPWADGDLAIERSPAVQVTGGGQSFLTVGYKRIGGVWVPIQELTGLVGI